MNVARALESESSILGASAPSSRGRAEAPSQAVERAFATGDGWCDHEPARLKTQSRRTTISTRDGQVRLNRPDRARRCRVSSGNFAYVLALSEYSADASDLKTLSGARRTVGHLSAEAGLISRSERLKAKAQCWVICSERRSARLLGRHF